MMGMGGMGLHSPGDMSGIGLKPERHIAGFSIRKEDGTALPLIFEAGVGKARDTVVLKLSGPVPAKASLWYGYGMDPYCNLTDGSDMAVPVFGPIALDEVSAPAGGGQSALGRAGQGPDHHRRPWTCLEGHDQGPERNPREQVARSRST